MFGALVKWTMTGFRGTYSQHLGHGVSYRVAIIGLLAFVLLLLATVIVIRTANL